MSELSEILRKEYKKKEKKKPIDFSMLMEMVEHLYDAIEPEVIEEEEARRFSVDIDLPKLIPTESWGDPGSQSRQEVERIFASVTGGGNMRARIAHVNSFLDPEAAKRKAPGGKSNTLLNMMMIIEALQATLNDYNEASSGFVFEAFMAALTGGRQESGRVGGTLPIEDFITGAGENVSLKLLSPDTVIHGSFTNLIDYLFLRGGGGVPSIKYLIALKDTEGGSVSKLALFAFEINRENFVDVMLGTKNDHLLGDAAEDLRVQIKAYPQDPKLASKWRKDMFAVLQRVPGYTENKGMFYKNVDETGEFDEEAGSKRDTGAQKKKSYARVLHQGSEVEAYNVGRQAALSGEAPDESAFAPESEPDVDPKTLRVLRKRYEEGYAQGIQDIDARATQEPVAESMGYFGCFHEDEKRMMKEELLLLEAGKSEGGSQWGISRTQMTAMTGLLLTEHYGEINLSSENIKKIAKIYTDKLGKDLVSLLTLTKEFTENIGKYYSTEERSEATAANSTAQKQGEEIVKTLKADPREA